MAHIGRKEQIGIGKESTKGTAVAATNWLPVTSGTLQPGNNKADDDGKYGRIEAGFDSYVSKQWTDVEIEGVVRDQTIGMLLMATFGAVSKTGSDPYTHAFTVQNDNDHPAYTIWSYDNVSTEKSAYCMLDSLELNVEADDFVRYSARFMGKKRVSDSNPSPSYADENAFRARDVNLYFASSEAGLSGATAVKARNVRISFTKNLFDYQAIGSTDLEAIYNQQLIVDGDFELIYDSVDEIDNLENNTKQYMKIEIINTDVDLGGAVNPELEFVLNKCAYTTWERTDGVDDIVMQTIGFRAEYNLTDSEMINATLVNGDSTDY